MAPEWAVGDRDVDVVNLELERSESRYIRLDLDERTSHIPIRPSDLYNYISRISRERIRSLKK